VALCRAETLSVKWRPLEKTVASVMGLIDQRGGRNGISVESTESIN
jgi:hypothetical protein